MLDVITRPAKCILRKNKVSNVSADSLPAIAHMIHGVSLSLSPDIKFISGKKLSVVLDIVRVLLGRYTISVAR